MSFPPFFLEDDLVRFVTKPLTLRDSNRLNRSCYSFELVDDNIFKPVEVFAINLNTTDPTVTLAPQRLLVMIHDDDG